VIRSRGDAGELIGSIEDWRTAAAPAGGERQWRRGRSARESASAWFRDGRPRLPDELHALFEDRGLGTDGFRAATVVPEWKTHFPDGSYGPRNHDVLIFGTARGGPTVVGVEVKADEPLDRPIRTRVNAALRERQTGRTTKFPERVDGFCRALFGFPAVDATGGVDERVADIPYQLVSGVSGTIVEAARHCRAQAVFVVHVLESDGLEKKKLEANRRGLTHFSRLLGLDPPETEGSWLQGLVTYPGCSNAELPVLPLYIGLAHGRC
jgi:hypothetical protein